MRTRRGDLDGVGGSAVDATRPGGRRVACGAFRRHAGRRTGRAEERYPALERRLRDEQGGLRRYVNFYVDGEECRRLAGPATPLRPDAEVVIIPSVAGG
ncbi:MoaD/ThiS family protein [Prauserella oleivorans]